MRVGMLLRPSAILALAMVLALLVAACGPGYGPAAESGPGNGGGSSGDDALAAPSGSRGPAGSAGSDRLADRDGAPLPTGDASAPQRGPSGPPEQQDDGGASVADTRLIVRTVDMALVVDDVTRAIDDVSALAGAYGGWVVSSQRTARHQGKVSIRVPAGLLDQAVRELRAMAVEVKAESAVSQDVTDEYVDLQARIRTYQATETQLLEVLQRPGEVKDILEVQREITKVREEIERLQGRAAFLEATSATSLVNVSLELVAGAMVVDVGPDLVVAEGESAVFRATFTPPEGITEFTFTWDFGDAAAPVTGTRTAPTVDGRSRATGTVTHAFADKADSPFIVTLEVVGTGEGGIARGSDTLIVTVTEVPNIQVSAGDDRAARVGDAVLFSGAFTRPEGVTDLTYRWDFGDGLPPETGAIPDNAGKIDVRHSYDLSRTSPYRATFAVAGRTSYGAEVAAVDDVLVRVDPQTPWVQSVYDLGASAKAAVQALGALVQTGVIAAIWVGVFSPVWLPAVIALVVIRRRGLWRAAGARPRPPVGGPQ